MCVGFIILRDRLKEDVENKNSRKLFLLWRKNSTFVLTKINKNMSDGKSSRKIWSKKEDGMLAELILEGKSSSEIAEVLGRTSEAIEYRISKKKIKMKDPKTQRKRDKSIDEVSSVIPTASTHDQAKVMARAARSIARSNGKRITMAMFFIENL